jgi:hypothetical protein
MTPHAHHQRPLPLGLVALFAALVASYVLLRSRPSGLEVRCEVGLGPSQCVFSNPGVLPQEACTSVLVKHAVTGEALTSRPVCSGLVAPYSTSQPVPVSFESTLAALCEGPAVGPGGACSLEPRVSPVSSSRRAHDLASALVFGGVVALALGLARERARRRRGLA